jgi:alpha-glucosidase
VSPDRVHLYASPETLGQAFAFECTKQSYHATSLRQTIDELYHVAREAGSTTTWVLSSHDVSVMQ